MGKLVNLQDLEFYVNLLEENLNEVITDYAKLVDLLKQEFDIDTTVRQIELMYSPNIEEDILDKQILYRNIME